MSTSFIMQESAAYSSCKVEMFVVGLPNHQAEVRCALDGAKLCSLNLNPPMKLEDCSQHAHACLFNYQCSWKNMKIYSKLVKKSNYTSPRFVVIRVFRFLLIMHAVSFPKGIPHIMFITKQPCNRLLPQSDYAPPFQK